MNVTETCMCKRAAAPASQSVATGAALMRGCALMLSPTPISLAGTSPTLVPVCVANTMPCPWFWRMVVWKHQRANSSSWHPTSLPVLVGPKACLCWAAAADGDTIVSAATPAGCCQACAFFGGCEAWTFTQAEYCSGSMPGAPGCCFLKVLSRWLLLSIASAQLVEQQCQ